MISADPRRHRRLVPVVDQLEFRRLLAVSVTSAGQSGNIDLVGPDASQGSDGIADLHLIITGLTAFIDHIVVTAPGGFAWATEPDPNGYALAEVFQSGSNLTNADLYINTQIRSDLLPPGGSLPLGGSTGSLIRAYAPDFSGIWASTSNR